MEIIWKDIEGYEGLYKVSNEGRVLSLVRSKKKHEKELSILVNENGYCYVRLFKSVHGSKHFKVHRLVASAFIHNNENFPQVNHKDTNKQNNHADNLEWVTRKRNMEHASEHKLFNVDNFGSKNPAAILTENDVLNIRKSHSENNKRRDLAEYYNVSIETINSIVYRKKWKHI